MSGRDYKILSQVLVVALGAFALFDLTAASSWAASLSVATSCSDLPCAIKSHDPGAVSRHVVFDVAYSAASSPCTPIKNALHIPDETGQAVAFLPWAAINAGPDDEYTGLVFGNLIERPSWTIVDYLNDGRRLLVVQDRGFARTYMLPSTPVGGTDLANPHYYDGLLLFRVPSMGPCHVNDDPLAATQHLVAGSRDGNGGRCNKPRDQLIHVPAGDKEAFPLLPDMHRWKIGVSFARVAGAVYTLYFSSNYTQPPVRQTDKSLGVAVDVISFSSDNYQNVCVLLSRPSRSADKSSRHKKDTR